MSSDPDHPVLGKYRLERLIARGGMGEIWEARQTGPDHFDRRVALKRIYQPQTPKTIELFLREAHIISQLEHPNIVRVYDFGEDNASYFFVMELVQGLDLARLLRHVGSLAPVIAARIGTDCCRSLEFAWNHVIEDGQPLRVVHRDVSPHNILLSRHGEVKLADFGIARTPRSASLTQAGQFRGKARYSSPEHLLGKEVDHRSDIFALAIVLFEALSGQHPFCDEQRVLRVENVVKGRVPDLRRLSPGVPEALERCILRALNADPAMRHSDAGAFLRDLDNSVRPLGGTASPDAIAALVLRYGDPRGSPSSEEPGLTRDASTTSALASGPESAPALENARTAGGTPKKWTRPALLATFLVASTVAWAATRRHNEAKVTAVVKAEAKTEAKTETEVEVESKAVFAPAVRPTPPPVRGQRPSGEKTAREDKRNTPGGPAKPSKSLRRVVLDGTVNVTSNPWSYLYVDGAARGSTPQILRLPPGQHALEFRDLDQRVRGRRSVIVTEGVSTTLDVDLR